MKIIKYIIVAACLVSACRTPPRDTTGDYRQSLIKTTAAIRDAFARGDVPAILALHHPDVIKYFGGDDVVKGRAALGRGLTATFKTSKLEFIDNRVENTLFTGTTAVETSIFTIRLIPKNGGNAVYEHSRSLVVYIRYKYSPYGWVALREVVQAAPADK